LRGWAQRQHGDEQNSYDREKANRMHTASSQTARGASRQQRVILTASLALVLAITSLANRRTAAQAVLTPGVAAFVTVPEPVVALEHVRVIDGMGAPARDDQTVVIADGRIAASGPSRDVRVPDGARRFDLTGRTVIPGLVGLHEHLFYPTGPEASIFTSHTFSFPRMYLAGGVTTARTGGTFDLRADRDIKRDIDIGLVPGPKLLLTAGYLDGPQLSSQMTAVRTADEAQRFVDRWAPQVHSFKAYTRIPRAALAAAVTAAHAHGLTITGHLCSVTFKEAAEMGIDNLEHGFIVASDWVVNKRANQCPPTQVEAFNRLGVNSAAAQDLIKLLVARKVAITSTLAVMEWPAIQQRFRDALAPATLQAYIDRRNRSLGLDAVSFTDTRKEVALERAFVAAGGLLVAGADPTGDGQVLPGFGDQRNIEMLVEGGFTPVEAIRVATLNGATLLGLADRIGSIAVGKEADLVVLNGNPLARIDDIERVVTVFVDGVGFDSARLLESIKGQVGLR
jgi:imidazolonepropionase-like amidohydrolase